MPRGPLFLALGSLADMRPNALCPFAEYPNYWAAFDEAPPLGDHWDKPWVIKSSDACKLCMAELWSQYCVVTCVAAVTNEAGSSWHSLAWLHMAAVPAAMA